MIPYSPVTLSTIVVHDLIGIFVHASGVCPWLWPAGSIRITRSEAP